MPWIRPRRLHHLSAVMVAALPLVVSQGGLAGNVTYTLVDDRPSRCRAPRPGHVELRTGHAARIPGRPGRLPLVLDASDDRALYSGKNRTIKGVADEIQAW